jgi:hypothetical protein
MQLLLALLRGQADMNVISDSEWMTVLDLAEQENLLPWAAACLRSAAGAATPPQLAARLHELDRNARMAAFFWTSTLKSTLADFHHRGIPVISLKGPWLAERLYGDAALRPYADLDLLVRPIDVAPAEALLRELGFVPTGRRDDYERPWCRNGVLVELHHNVENPLAFDLEIESAWSRAQVAQFHGVSARLLAPSDELLFLCLHGARHRFERLSHVLDLAFAFRCLPLPHRPARSRRVSESTNILALGAMMATHLDPQLTIANEVCNCVRDRMSLQELADQLWQERMLQPAPRLDWSMQHRFYIEIETSWWNRFLRRVRHLRILMTRLIDADFTFAERFNLRRRWQVWLLRPMRLLLNTGRASPSPP